MNNRRVIISRNKNPNKLPASSIQKHQLNKIKHCKMPVGMRAYYARLTERMITFGPNLGVTYRVNLGRNGNYP